jgi:ABC-type antimicrobial peptide transport system permease subunit
MVMAGGLKLVGIGAAVGILLAAALSGAIGGLLYGVPSIDVTTYALVAIVLLAVAVAAAWLPARRASRMDPLRALRGS